jgi:hypothetical protein
MPPAEAPQPDDAGREALVRWLDRGIAVARSRPTPRNGSIRRLTVPQWRNSIRDLLGIDDDVAAGLPPDPVSRDGFTNQSATIQFTPLQAEAFLEAASRGLDAALVDPDAARTVARCEPGSAQILDRGRGGHVIAFCGHGLQRIVQRFEHRQVSGGAHRTGFIDYP